MTQPCDTDRDPNLWVRPSEVRLGFAPSVSEFLEYVKLRTVASGEDIRLVSFICERLPPLGHLIEKVLADLAEVALALWPDWYYGAIPFAAIDQSVFAFEDRLTEALVGAGQLRQAVAIPWIQEARRLCRVGRTPITMGFTRAVQAAQLALAISPRDLLFVLAVIEEEPPEGRLLGLARVSEWLGRTTGARILVIVPTTLARSNELDGINSDPISQPSRTAPTPTAPTENPPVDVWPVIGRPHPYSPGEQLLASRLAGDEMLRGLFRFNVSVRSRFESRFLVDLLWPEGRLVVEVDGYEHHSNRLAFSLDRRRDYELHASDYIVLRLPHDEVMQDVEIAIEKIRDLVLIRRSKDGQLP